MSEDLALNGTPDQIRAAQKRKAAAELADAAGRSAAPEERHAPEAETAAPTKRAAKKR